MLDRRRGSDPLVKWVKWSGIISWILIAIVLIIVFIAKPGFESYMDRSFHIRLGNSWDSDLMRLAFILMVFLFFFCMISIVINLLRCRRKTDRFNKTLIINAVASFIGMLLYLLYFI